MSTLIDFLAGEIPSEGMRNGCQTENLSPLTKPKETLGKRDRRNKERIIR